MTLIEATQQGLLKQGVKRPGWTGYIRALWSGAIWFHNETRVVEEWFAYEQDLNADDWEPVRGEQIAT